MFGINRSNVSDNICVSFICLIIKCLTFLEKNSDCDKIISWTFINSLV